MAVSPHIFQTEKDVPTTIYIQRQPAHSTELSTMTVFSTNESIDNAVNGAKEGLKQLMYQDSNGKWHAKVCCFCDRLIGHNNESSIKVGDLRVVKDRLMKNKYLTKLPLAVKQHYTVQCLDLTPNENRFLRTIFLSRRSYEVTTDGAANTSSNNRTPIRNGDQRSSNAATADSSAAGTTQRPLGISTYLMRNDLVHANCVSVKSRAW